MTAYEKLKGWYVQIELVKKDIEMRTAEIDRLQEARAALEAKRTWIYKQFEEISLEISQEAIDEYFKVEV
jgi:hypothetical protein